MNYLIKKVFFIKKFFIRFFLFCLPLKRNYIIFESIPDFSGSPWAIYQEFCRRKFNKKYKMVWAVDRDSQTNSKEKSVTMFGQLSLVQRIKKNIILNRAKLIVDSNRFVFKINPKTFRLHTQHGAPLKKVLKYTSQIGSTNSILSLSEAMSTFERCMFLSSNAKFEPLGYPCNDQLFETVNLYEKRFWQQCTNSDKRFRKVIGWFPTYRQHRSDNSIGTSFIFPFGIPLLKSVKDFESVNAFLKENNILLAIQMHHAQAENFPKQTYSNIVLISPSLKQELDVSNANLMQSFDALITDYSGAYHEYLLLNRPIALSIDDYDEYAKNPGFCLDYFDWIKGVYLKDTSNLLNFIKEVANEIDSARKDRETSLHRIHKYVDNQSTKRVVDYLCKNAKL